MASGQERDAGQPRTQGHDGQCPFKSETIPISAVGANVTKVQQMLDRVGFQ